VNFININSLQNSIPVQNKRNIPNGTGDTGKNKSCQPITTPSFSSAASTAPAVEKSFMHKVSHIIDKTMRGIESGGFFAEFLVLDVLGMMGPRTIQAYLRNKDELGHLNHKAGREEAIREVLTGPSFFVVPLAFLALSNKLFGSATKVKVDVLNGLHDVAKDAVKNGSKHEERVHGFYKGIVNHLYGDADKHKDVTEAFVKLHDASMNPQHKKPEKAVEKVMAFFKKPEAENVSKAQKELRELLLAKNKLIGNDTTKGISSADYSKIKFFGKDPIQGVGNIIEDCKNYAKDVFKHIKDNPAKFEQIHKNKVIARSAITVTGIATLSGILYSIPILYKQNKDFPGIDGLANAPTNDNNVIEKRAV
jgi:hypothetical protein